MPASLQKKLSAIFSYRVTLVFSFILLLPPVIVDQVKHGIDPSWKIALGLANSAGLVFGKDIVFTYGPLHYLITKAGISYEHKWFIVFFEMAAIFFVLFILSGIYRKETHPLKGAALVLFSFLFSNISCEYYLTLIFLYSVYKVLLENRTEYLIVMLAISVVTFFIKINFGFINFMAMLPVAAAHAIKTPKRIPAVALIILSFPLSLAALAPLLHVDVKEYVLTGLSVIDGYSDAMVIPFVFTDSVDCIGLVIFCVFGFFVLSNLRFLLQPSHVLPALLFLFYFFLLFKNGFVRVDGHIFIFIFNSLILYIVFYVWNDRLRHIRECFAAALLLAFLSIPLAVLNYAVLKNDSWFNPMEKCNLWTYGADVFRDLSYKSKFQASQVDPVKVSNAQLRILSGKTADILPIDISIIYRHNLRYNPRPVIQSYSAYNLFLDSLNYKKYSSASAPDYLLFLNRSIDHRVAFWDESVTKRAIMQHYALIEEPVRYDTSFLLFEKREVPRRDSVVVISDFETTISSAVDVPQDSGNIYLYMDVRYSLWGTLQRAFFQAPVMHVLLTYDDGTAATYRCIPTILKTGVLINKSVKTNQDAYNFFSGKHAGLKKIVRFQLLPKAGFDTAVQGRFVTVKERP